MRLLSYLYKLNANHAGISFLLLCCIIVLTQCISEFNAQLPEVLTNVPVLQGNIISDTTCVFTLTRTYPLHEAENIENDAIALSKAVIRITDGNGGMSEPATPVSTSGKDYASASFQIRTGRLDPNLQYALQVEFEGETYLSAFSKPLVTPGIDAVSFVQPEKDGNVIIRVSTRAEGTDTQYFMWNYIEDWETSAYFHVLGDFSTGGGGQVIISPNTKFYCWKNNICKDPIVKTTANTAGNGIVSQDLCSVDATDDRFTMLYSILVSQYSISEDAYNYYDKNIILNEDMGDLFMPQPTEIRGNITCISNPDSKMIGYVNVVNNVTYKRFYIDASEISSPYFSDCIELDNEQMAKRFNGINNMSYWYVLGWRPVQIDGGEEKMVPKTWSQAKCTDCTYNGGTKNKPSFWPNDHQ